MSKCSAMKKKPRKKRKEEQTLQSINSIDNKTQTPKQAMNHGLDVVLSEYSLKY